MKRTDLNRFRRRLQGRLEELGSATRQREAIVIETSPDDLDRRLRAADREFALHGLERAARDSREVRAALARLHDGTYGQCLDCGEAISPARLAALPWAPLCIRCQSAVDGQAWPMAA